MWIFRLYNVLDIQYSLDPTIVNLKVIENYLPLQSVCKRKRIRILIFCVCLQMPDRAGKPFYSNCVKMVYWASVSYALFVVWKIFNFVKWFVLRGNKSFSVVFIKSQDNPLKYICCMRYFFYFSVIIRWSKC